MDYNQLLKDCLKGKTIAQKQLYDHFAPAMLAICYRYTKSIRDAEDILQEGFIKVFLNLHQFKGSGELGGWIRRIMVTTAINAFKKRALKNEFCFIEEQVHIIHEEASPELKMEVKELANLIRQLPVGYQTIFNLYAVEGFEHKEIGKMLGIHEGTSRSQYARARGLLIKWIEKENCHCKT